ncbi:tyrosine-protein phosphatase [Leifsonia sp. P73]|uniref:tyrosine-protein phosphatase n=1 Tax=Leifsonia sp. P73 TaxID=3423959 RepID=UPI003DA47BA2
MSTDEGTRGAATGAVAERIPVNGTYNFRDAGGYPVAEGVVRRGKLFRSDGLARLGDEGRQALRDLDVRVVIDLRDDFEVSVLPDDVAGLGLQRLHLPVFEGSGASQSTIGITLVGLYEKILLQHGDVVVTALREIADTGEEAVVVHCTAGKDRTGIVVALALLAVGVDRDLVVADYAATQANLRGPWLDAMIDLVRSHGVEVTPTSASSSAAARPRRSRRRSTWSSAGSGACARTCSPPAWTSSNWRSCAPCWWSPREFTSKP